MTTAHNNGVPIHYTDHGGDGPAVLFSHGFMMDGSMFDKQVEALSGDFRCITWDGRGFGNTPADGPFTYWDLADDAIAVLDACGVDQAVLVGMSQGGFLSLRAALAHPSRVAGVVLIDSAADTDDAETIAGYEQLLAVLAGGDEDMFDGVATVVAGLILGNNDLAAEWIPLWKARERSSLHFPGRALLDRDDISERLGEITAPLLVVHGDADMAISVGRGRAVCEGVRDCRGVEVISGGAHASNMTHPEPVNEVIRAFLGSL
ncbi:MAG: alpha/beta hydrolase [Actinobacteria bacterium]|nr:alpha/beta hydrolase [Actinomycetota bacterium]